MPLQTRSTALSHAPPHQSQQQGVLVAQTMNAGVVGGEKVLRVDSDVRAMSVAGPMGDVWIAHHDGSLAVRSSRTTDVMHAFTAPPSGQGRPWSLVTVRCESGVDYVWAGLSNGDVEVYNSETRCFVRRLHRHTGGVYTLAHFGGYVFTGSADFTICMWCAERQVFIRQLSGHRSYVRCLSAEGLRLVSGSDDHRVHLWDVGKGTLDGVGHFHEAGVAALCRVGPHMWSGDDTGTIAIWRYDTLALQASIANQHTARVTVIKKIGARVYTGGTDRRLVVWDAYLHSPLRNLSDHQGWVSSLLCPAELARYYVWSSAADGTIRCWHHDEFRVMSEEAERYDDMRWYYGQVEPHRGMNTGLIAQIADLESKLSFTQSDGTESRVKLEKMSVELESAKQTNASLESQLAAALKRAEVAESALQLKSTTSTKQAEEIQAFQEKVLKLTADLAALRLEAETAKSCAAESERKRIVAAAELASAEDLCEKLRNLKKEEFDGLAPVVVRVVSSGAAPATASSTNNTTTTATASAVKPVGAVVGPTSSTVSAPPPPPPAASPTSTTTPSSALNNTASNNPKAIPTVNEGDAMLALHRDLTALLHLNTALREEVDRYKSLLGVQTVTPVPLLVFGNNNNNNNSNTATTGPAPQPLVPAPPSAPRVSFSAAAATPTGVVVGSHNNAAAATTAAPAAAATTTNPASATSVLVQPSVPLVLVQSPPQSARSSSSWANPNVGSYLHDRYFMKRSVVPIVGSTTPRGNSLSPRVSRPSSSSRAVRRN